jgi:hypothetical protein
MPSPAWHRGTHDCNGHPLLAGRNRPRLAAIVRPPEKVVSRGCCVLLARCSRPFRYPRIACTSRFIMLLWLLCGSNEIAEFARVFN